MYERCFRTPLSRCTPTTSSERPAQSHRPRYPGASGAGGPFQAASCRNRPPMEEPGESLRRRERRDKRMSTDPLTTPSLQEVIARASEDGVVHRLIANSWQDDLDAIYKGGTRN